MDGMFNWQPSEGQSLSSPYLWIFFVITIPLTVVVYIGWFWWFRRLQKEYAKQYEDSDFAAVEQDLMKRMRTATNSFPIEKQPTSRGQQ